MISHLRSRGAVLALVLVTVLGSFAADGAEAGNRRYKHSNAPPGHGYARGHARTVVVHHDVGYYPSYGSSCGSQVAAFIGGVAVGAIVSHIGGGYYPPPPPPPPPPAARVWVYDCDGCGYHCRDYGDWCNHLCGVHGVPRCDVAVSYPVGWCGHWEGY